MKNQTLIQNLNQLAKVDNTWQDDVSYYDANKSWLDLSAQIAIKVVRALRKNRNEGNSPSTQKELAEVMQVSPQQINKLVQGKENLTLETITRLEKALTIELVSINKNIYEATTPNVASKPLLFLTVDTYTSNKSMKSLDNMSYFNNCDRLPNNLEEVNIGRSSYAMAG